MTVYFKRLAIGMAAQWFLTAAEIQFLAYVTIMLKESIRGEAGRRLPNSSLMDSLVNPMVIKKLRA